MKSRISILLLMLFSWECYPTEPPVAYQPHNDIRKVLKIFLTDYAKGKKLKNFSLQIGSIDPRLYLKRCSAPLETYLHSSSNRSGFVTVVVRCAGESSWKIYVSNKISFYTNIVLLKNTVPRGRILEAGDLQIQRRQISHLGYGYYSDPKQLIGKIARQVIFSGSVLHPQLLNEPKWVRRGQTVILIAETGGITVRMSGTALSSGTKGKFIRVKNLSSKRVVEGVIIRPGVVKIDL